MPQNDFPQPSCSIFYIEKTTGLFEFLADVFTNHSLGNCVIAAIPKWINQSELPSCIFICNDLFLTNFNIHHSMTS